MKKLIILTLASFCVIILSTGCGRNGSPYLDPSYTEMYVGDTLSVKVMNWSKHMDAEWRVPKELNIQKASVNEIVVVAKEETVDTVFIWAKIGACDTEHGYYRMSYIKILPKEDSK